MKQYQKLYEKNKKVSHKDTQSDTKKKSFLL